MAHLPKLLICSFDAIPSATSTSRRLLEYVRGIPPGLSVDIIVPRLHQEPLQAQLGPARLFRVPSDKGSVERRGEAFDRAVRRFVETQEYTLAHFTHSWGGMALCDLKSELGFHAVFDAQDLKSESSDAESQKRIQREQLFCLMKADAIITGSKMASRHIHSLGAPKDKISVLAPPIPYEDYQAFLDTKMATPGLRLCCLGFEMAPQDLSTTLQALSLLPRNLLVELVIAESQTEKPQNALAKEIDGLRLGHLVSLEKVNSYEDLPGLLSQMDAGIVPMGPLKSTFPKTQPLSMAAEFFAAACPILVPDTPFSREEFPLECTFFYAQDDAQKLAELITKLAQSPDLRLSASPQAKAFAQRHLDRHVVQKRLFHIYESLTQSSLGSDSSSRKPPLIEKVDVLHTQHSGVIGPLDEDIDWKDVQQRDLWFSQLALGYCPPLTPPL